MNRRTFVQALLTLPAAPLIRTARWYDPREQTTIEVEITDNQNTPPAQLATLVDGDRQTGVDYQP